ncbi:MAG: argininosuccinate lyase [Rhodospirillales bacterium]|nr:argininosuccinate lyase [Rhodospirillales bacterium]
MSDAIENRADENRVNDLWGGRFAAGPAAIMAEINASIGVDKRLVAEDVEGSKAHCRMLIAQGIISQEDGAAILAGLDRVLAAFRRGEIALKSELEDIHMHVEAALQERIGEAAGRLHTARSRNDQVATDLRLFLRRALDRLDRALVELLSALIARAEEEAATVLPGHTHLQAAQPVTFGHHLLAYVEMLERDRGRLADCRARMNESPLGAAALAGTSFPIDREMTARALGFVRPMRNSMDAVSARDCVLEFLAAGGILATHLSRLAEEIVIWMSEGFRFVSLSDAFTTGSSIMPQKRNPDAAELVRGKTGRILGAFTGLAITLKGLPMTYAKDMQEDKEPLFDTVDNLALMLAASAGMVRDMTVDRARMRAACAGGFLTATDLADWLVRVLGLPFRRAHRATGSLVQRAEALGCDLAELPLAEMQAVEPRIDRGVYDVLPIERSVASRTSLGGTAPERVRAAAAAARARLGPAP